MTARPLVLAGFSPRYHAIATIVTVDIRGPIGCWASAGIGARFGDRRWGGLRADRHATTRTPAMVLALARPGLTIVPPEEADAIAPMAIDPGKGI